MVVLWRAPHGLAVRGVRLEVLHKVSHLIFSFLGSVITAINVLQLSDRESSTSIVPAAETILNAPSGPASVSFLTEAAG